MRLLIIMPFTNQCIANLHIITFPACMHLDEIAMYIMIS